MKMFYLYDVATGQIIYYVRIIGDITMKMKMFYLYDVATGQIIYKDKYPEDVAEPDFWNYVMDLCSENGLNFSAIDWEYYEEKTEREND